MQYFWNYESQGAPKKITPELQASIDDVLNENKRNNNKRAGYRKIHKQLKAKGHDNISPHTV